ncbi:MAG TPA: hypothetical protein PKZ12_05870, partial [Smithellaceae bacterium]|nr:hypothetical protein [Smithellaceae bacterium]
MIVLKLPDEIKKARMSSRIVAEVLDTLRKLVRPGVKTIELNRIAEQITAKRGAKPAFKGYHGYPYALCTSSRTRWWAPSRKARSC